LKSLIIKNYYRCLGLYSLKDEFSRLTGTFELNTLRKTPKPEEIVSLITGYITNGTIFQNNQSMLLSEDKNKSQDEISNSAKSDNECRDSQLVRPKWLVANNKIVHVTQGKAFNVMNENDEPYLVRIFPKPSCTCKSQQTKCCHIIAVQLSLGIEVKNSMSLPNLTKLRRNMQNGQKTGRKMRGHKKYKLSK
jgi:hypothetical protein